MSTDQQPAPYDPRYDGIYQRGGPASVQSHDAEPRHVEAEGARSTTTPAFAHEQRRVDAPAVEPGPDPAIREVGAPPDAPEASGPSRNPVDVWIWVVAAVLTGIGVYLTAAPILFERAMMEAQATGMSGSVYLNPWFNYTMSVAPTLVLLGVGTAVVQLFLLSIRHTLRSRPDAGVHRGSHSGP